MRKYTLEEMKAEMTILKKSFDIVRLINPILNEVIELDRIDLTSHKSTTCACFNLFDKEKRCSSCISALTLQTQQQNCKFELIHNNWYFILSRFVIVENVHYSLETLYKIKDNLATAFIETHSIPEKYTKLNKLVMLDELTGIYNRRYFNEQSEFLLSNENQNRSSTALAIVDLDHLKTINDTYGHLAGDAAICAIADVVQKNISRHRGDFISRIGGDEFAVIFQNIDREVLQKRLFQINQLSREIILKIHPDIRLSTSIGAILLNEHPSLSMIELLDLADKKLYEAKKTRGTVVL